MGALFVVSCAGEAGPDDSMDLPGATTSKGGANGAAGKPATGTAGQSATGAAGHTNSGSAGTAQPVTGAAGQPASGSAGQPATGAAGQTGTGDTGQPVTGAAGQPASGDAGQPATGTAGQTGTGSADAGQPVTGAAGQPASGSAGQPATGAAGQTGTGSADAGQPATGAAGQPASGSAGQPATGAAGQPASGSAGQPATGAGGQAGSGSVAPPAGGTTGTTTPPSTTAGATIVPLYTSPGDASWNAVIAAKMAHPKVSVIAIVNPSNGPGGSADSGYASGIARLTAAGIRVIGYVATGYTAVSSSTVKADIDRWKAFYPGQVTGIFFDEQSNKAGDVAYYRDLSQYSKAQGLSFTVGNPGTDTAEAFVGALDMMLLYESAGLPSTGQLGGWHANHPASNFGIIPHATQLDATFVRNARKNVGYIYLQNDNLPNPWDSVPSYFSDLLAALE